MAYNNTNGDGLFIPDLNLNISDVLLRSLPTARASAENIKWCGRPARVVCPAFDCAGTELLVAHWQDADAASKKGRGPSIVMIEGPRSGRDAEI
jgi:hypothetical protein